MGDGPEDGTVGTVSSSVLGMVDRSLFMSPGETWGWAGPGKRARERERKIERERGGGVGVLLLLQIMGLSICLLLY